jgi:hypothetical protein
VVRQAPVADELLELLCTSLIERLRDGTATASDMNVARQLLKDQGAGALLTVPSAPVLRLADALPFKDEDLAPSVQELKG